MSKKAIIIIGVLASLFFVGLSFYSSLNSTRNDGIAMEQGISVTYEDNQNHLSAYISTLYEQFGIAKFKSTKLDTILTHAVQGRYGPNGFSAKGAFFSAVAEAYPDLTALNVFDRLMETVAAGRENFKSRQSLLLDKIRIYETWLRQGILRHVLVQFLGFPSDQLQARVGGKTVATGKAALEQFHLLVITSSTAEAFQTGRQEPIKLQD